MENLILKVKRKGASFLRHIMIFKIGAFIRIFKKKKSPKGEKVLLHIGCGDLIDKRYINIDIRPGWHIDYVAQVEGMKNIFSKDYADLIYGCMVLEHISHQKTLEILEDLRKILKPGGSLRLSVPDFDTIVKMYEVEKSVKDIMSPLMGGQGYQGNFHFSIFNEKYLTDLLLKAGFSEVKKWNPENAEYYNFDDWANRKIDMYGKDWEISLNLEAIK